VYAFAGRRGRRQAVLYRRSLTFRVSLEKVSPDALVRGYGTALAGILARLAADLASQNPAE
jgi:hypothetical protein